MALASACSDKTCGDVIASPSQSVCSAYLSTCFYNGTNCATIPPSGACSTYALTSATACNNLINNAATPAACGYVALATTCSDKTCEDVIAFPSQTVCYAYLSICYYNGTNCATKPVLDLCRFYFSTSAIVCNNLTDNSAIPT